MKSPVQLFIAVAILLATATVAAQVYKWVDKDGKVQYSDTPPPASATKVEAKRIDTPPAAAASTGAVPEKSLQDRAKDYDKRKAAVAEKAKKSDTEKQNADLNVANCANARSALRDLESGRPLVRTAESGDREFVSDEARQADIAKARKSIADFCKE